MTKTEFIKKYGAKDTSVTFKSTTEIDAFLKECESFGIEWNEGQRATEYKGREYLTCTPITILSGGRIRYNSFACKVAYELMLTPKQMIKDGWYGLRDNGEKIYFLPSIKAYCISVGNSYPILNFDDELQFDSRGNSIKELFDADGVSQWKREIKKSAHDLEIERIEAEMKAQAEITKKLADDLAKLKGGN